MQEWQHILLQQTTKSPSNKNLRSASSTLNMHEQANRDTQLHDTRQYKTTINMQDYTRLCYIGKNVY